MLEGDTLWDLVRARAERTPDALLAIDESGRRLTFAEYHALAERAAAGFAQLGVTRDAVVSWQLPTWVESLVLVAALSRLGAVQNPILPILREREVGFIARQARPTLLLTPRVWRGFDFRAMAEEVAATTPGVEVLTIDRELPDGDPARLPAPPASPDAELVRWLYYTSGTTADPKGAQHSDAGILATARGMSSTLALTAADRVALVFPFTHIAGAIWLASALLAGCTHLVTEAFDPVATTELLHREGVTLGGAGTAFHLAYLKAQEAHPEERLFPRLRACPGGGAPRPPQLHARVRDNLGGVGVVSGWGLTEAPILTMAAVDDPDAKLATTEGRPMPGVDLRVVTPDGRPAPPGTDGELRAKAPQLMKGYLDPALSAEAFDADGYFRTGDLGRVDADGFVTITGRIKDIIIRKGENISAKEVEDLLSAHPAVAEVAVIGLPDPEVGERCAAVVVPTDPECPLEFPAMVGFLRERGLVTRKLPERLELVDALPRNPTGKVVKKELVERFAGRMPAG
ncbi:MAG: class I adenylate-forming enzyme family protein [Mycobacteriales bacterium]